jgi:hypothetical protein
MSYKNYSDEDIIEAVKHSFSFSAVLKKLNLLPAGGNFLQLKKNIARLNLDISHFKGSAWNKDLFLKPCEDYVKPAFLKRKVISKRGHKCENCGREKWENQTIPLELHHIDSNRLNNKEENLQLLCPNCHAQTEGYRRRKK